MSSQISETLPSFDTASASNPIIQYSGQASFGANFYCMWVTKNGPVATLTVSNPGPNTLTFTVSGAPGTIVASDGKPLNGTHVIPPNQPTSKIIALGDFQGQNVFIFNVSNPSTTCQVNAITT